jgi:hypothetical protein
VGRATVGPPGHLWRLLGLHTGEAVSLYVSSHTPLLGASLLGSVPRTAAAAVVVINLRPHGAPSTCFNRTTNVLVEVRFGMVSALATADLTARLQQL